MISAIRRGGAGTPVHGGGRAGRTGELGWSGEHVPETAATEGCPAGCEAGRCAQVIPSLVFYHVHCGFRRLLRSALPAVLWVSLVGVPTLRRWVGSPWRSWRVEPRPHRLRWIRGIRGRRTGARIRRRVPLVHQGLQSTPLLSTNPLSTGSAGTRWNLTTPHKWRRTCQGAREVTRLA